MALYIKNMAKPAVLATELVQNNLAGSNPAEIYAAARRHEEGGDDETAVRLLAELLRIQPQHADALQLLASILLKLGDPEEALRCAESAMESGETGGFSIETTLSIRTPAGPTGSRRSIHAKDTNSAAKMWL